MTLLQTLARIILVIDAIGLVVLFVYIVKIGIEMIKRLRER